MWPPENWRQIHHSDKIDMNKIFKGHFIDTHRCHTHNSFEYKYICTYSYVHEWTTGPGQWQGTKKLYNWSTPGSLPQFVWNLIWTFFFLAVFFCAKIIYRWNEKFNVLVISICLGTMCVRITYNIFQMKSRYTERFIRFCHSEGLCGK